jgi:hypothetical protein
MIGEKQIIEARREGLRPAAIFVEAGYMPTVASYEFEKHERALDHGFFPTVTLTPDDMRKRLDLRFCAGCRVHVTAPSMTDEVLALAERLVEVGAAHVIAGALDTGEILEWKNGTWRALI